MRTGHQSSISQKGYTQTFGYTSEAILTDLSNVVRYTQSTGKAQKSRTVKPIEDIRSNK
uniref:Uncharacterized protein n=1 Tax=Setaria italica TaxID=4555 RepID=K3YL92_SETIT